MRTRKIAARRIDGSKRSGEQQPGAPGQPVSPNDELCDYPATVHGAISNDYSSF